MDLVTDGTGHRLVNVTVLRGIFGDEALHPVSGFGAVVHEERHANNIPFRATKRIDFKSIIQHFGQATWIV
jgi:hypothetical protein